MTDNETKEIPLDPSIERDRLEIASQLYERFCRDLTVQSDKARVRLVSGIQIALRHASEGDVVAPFTNRQKPEELGVRVEILEEIVRNLDPAGRP